MKRIETARDTEGGAQTPTGQDELDILRPAEVGAKLRVSRATVYRLIASGELATVHVGVRRATRIPRAAVMEYIARNRIERSA